MKARQIIWLPRVRRKLSRYRSDLFSPEETYDFITQTLLEAESLLSNSILSRSYTEEAGDYKGITRIVVNRFKFYYELDENEITIVAVLSPGEN